MVMPLLSTKVVLIKNSIYNSNPLIYLIVRLCLVFEQSGVCSAAWLLALIHKQVVGYYLDEVFIGTAEERAEDDFDIERGDTPIDGEEEHDVLETKTRESWDPEHFCCLPLS